MTKFDFERLTELLKKYSIPGKTIDTTALGKLMNEFKKAKKVDSRSISSDYVTMNSVFELKALDNLGKSQFRLLFPEEADTKNGKLSVLSSVSTAVLSYRKGDVIKWELPAGEKYFLISKIIYQPEAAGDYHL